MFFSQVINFTEVYALPSKNIEQFLINREKTWPNWNLTKLKSSNINQDLIYPEWFEGNWIIESKDLNNNLQEPLMYKVNFFKNEQGSIVQPGRMISPSVLNMPYDSGPSRGEIRGTAYSRTGTSAVFTSLPRAFN